jgi:glycosyltransferase involved in cell wall biosynthesis
MRIAMIGHKRIPGREGGIEVVVEELTGCMVNMGHQVTVYNRKTKRIKKRIKEYKGARIITVPTIEKKSTDAIIYSFFASIHALFCKYDVIHYHALGPSVMLLIPHFFGIRTVVTVHGLNYKTPKWRGLGAKVILIGEKIVAKYANEIIVLSKEQEKYFKTKYGRQTIYIPNGVSLQKTREAHIIKDKWHLNSNGYILFLSRIVPGKGLEHLIEAYKKIDTNLPLVIAGGSAFVSEFYTKICKSAEQDKRIQMIGFVKGEALEELYSNAALFVFPSEAEGMPMCLLEALSYNVPCLVSDIPENLEVGDSYVQSFKTSNVEDLRGKLELVLMNREKMYKKNSREYIAEKFNWERVVRNTLQCYEEK